MLRKVRVLSRFRANLLAGYKGFVIRVKILKTFQFRMLIKDIKNLRHRQGQLAYLNHNRSV